MIAPPTKQRTRLKNDQGPLIGRKIFASCAAYVAPVAVLTKV